MQGIRIPWNNFLIYVQSFSLFDYSSLLDSAFKNCVYVPDRKTYCLPKTRSFVLKNQNILSSNPVQFLGFLWLFACFSSIAMPTKTCEEIFFFFFVNRKILRKTWKDLVSTDFKKPGFHVFMMMMMNCFCKMVNRRKAFTPCFQLGPLSEILTIANLRHTARRVWTCAKSELRLCWRKLCNSDKKLKNQHQKQHQKKIYTYFCRHYCVEHSSKIPQKLVEKSIL